MLIQYTYTHTCGHLGTGPILTYPIDTLLSPCPPNPSTIKHITITLSLPCPFCIPHINHNTASGSGVLCVLNGEYWARIKDIPLNELRPADWKASWEWNAQMGRHDFRHMAWIPRPEGYVSIETINPESRNRNGNERTYADVLNGRTGPERFGNVQGNEIHYRTEVRSTWKERVGVVEMMRGGVGIGSRMAGLISQFQAAQNSGERAGRYQ
jgi:hypothetical protein